MTSTAPGTVAVVVNYRTAGSTLHAIRALQTSSSCPSTIIVVDNGSSDGSASRIAAGAPGIHLIEQAENRGFSAGCNIGIREALRHHAKQVLLLNGDATLLSSALSEMARLLDADQQLGIVGPIVVSTAPANQIESCGISYSRRTGRMRNLDFGKALPATDRPGRRDVDAVSGCAMLITRPVFEQIGLFDEEYFFGFEDIDFCMRATAARFRVAVAGGAIVEHEGQASIGRRSAERIYFATRNHLRIGTRGSLTGSVGSRATRTTAILAFNLAYALMAADVPRLEGFRGFLRGARDHFAGHYGAGSFSSQSEPARR